MPTYYNPSKPDNYKIADFGLPKFANKYLEYLIIEKNAASSTVFNYAVSIRTFLRWVKSLEMGSDASVTAIDAQIPTMTVENISSLTTQDIYDFMAYCSRG